MRLLLVYKYVYEKAISYFLGKTSLVFKQFFYFTTVHGHGIMVLILILGVLNKLLQKKQ